MEELLRVYKRAMDEKKKELKFETLVFGILLALTGSLWLWFGILILGSTKRTSIGGTLVFVGNTVWVLGITATFWYVGFKDKFIKN